MAGKYLSSDLIQNINISSLYDRSLEVYGIKLVASGSVGGNISVPDECFDFYRRKNIGTDALLYCKIREVSRTQFLKF